MLSLISLSLKKKDIERVITFPRTLMSKEEHALIDYITEYRQKYGVPPTMERVQEEEEFAWVVEMPVSDDEVIDDLFDQAVKRARKEYTLAKLDELRTSVLTTGEVDDMKFSQVMESIATTSAEVISYSTFDRSAYFRHGNSMNIGLSVIDRATRGVYPGEFFVFVARLGVGKSTTTQFIMNMWHLFEQRRILLISKEMPPADVFSRMDAIVGQFNPLDLRGADGDEKQVLQAKLDSVVHIVKRSKGEIFMPRMEVWEVSTINTLARNLNVDAIVIDGLYHLTTNERFASNWESVAAVSRQTKAMSMSLRVPVIATTQLRRGSGKGGGETTVDDIAYSDAIGQDADFVCALSDNGNPDKKRLEANLLKNRYGPLASVLVDIDFSSMRMEQVL